MAMGSTETHARTIKLAFIDLLSGGMASITEAAILSFSFLPMTVKCGRSRIPCFVGGIARR